MKLFYDLLPIVLFFIGFKLYGIYFATGIAMLASLGQVIYLRLKYQRYELLHLANLGIILILGGATLLFHNPLFIKWKPTGIYWVTALVFLLSAFFGKAPLIKRILQKNIELPEVVWARLNYSWVAFFIAMGLLNLYVAYNFSMEAWVNFKLLGSTGLMLVFVVIQAFFLSKYSNDNRRDMEN